MNRDGFPAWSEIGQESIWGRRGLIKANCLWLPLAVLLTLFIADNGPASPGGGSLALRVWAAITAVVCWALASTLANDLVDAPADRRAGKCRWITRLDKREALAAVALLVVGGVAALALVRAGAGVVLAYLGGVALGIGYSSPPLKAKQRGMLGLVVYGLASVVAYVGVPWGCLPLGWATPAILGAAVFLNKWVHLHFHQVIDLEVDCESGYETYAVRQGRATARNVLRRFEALAVAAMAAVWFTAVDWASGWRWSVVLLVAATAAAAVAHRISEKQPDPAASALLRELSPLYLGFALASFCLLPMVLFLRLALLAPILWPPAIFCILLLLLEAAYAYRYRYR